MRFWTTISLIVVLSVVGLTYEIAAGRVLAPFFGTSLVTWTAVIATVLAGFSLGSAVGGFMAERDRREAVRGVRKALAATAILMALSPTVLALLYELGARGTEGMLLTVFVAFFPASVLVTIPSPLLAKIAVEARPGREGSSLGLVLASGSLGAIFGAILAGFVTLPLIGSAATFVGCGAAALICAFFVHSRQVNKAADQGSEPTMFASAGPAVLVLAASMTNGPVCQYESGLSCIDVIRHGKVVQLMSDRTPQAIESVVRRDEVAGEDQELVIPYTKWIWGRMDKDLGSSPSVLFIGGGGYTLPTKLVTSRPEATATAVEIDPLITTVVQKHLPRAGAILEKVGYQVSTPQHDRSGKIGRIGIVHQDGRIYINETDKRFDSVVMDAFSSSSVPAHLATKETYLRIKEISDGPVYVNLIDRPDGQLARGIHQILKRIYPHIEAVQGPTSPRGLANTVITASKAPLAAEVALPNEFQRVEISPGRAFTDDRGWVGHR